MPQICFRPHKACLLSRDSKEVRFSLGYLARKVGFGLMIAYSTCLIIVTVHLAKTT